jgi:hypothetical protein
MSIDLQSYSSFVTTFTEYCSKIKYVLKLNRQFLLKHNLVLINLYWRKADFLKNANFLEICIFKGIGQLYRKDVNIKTVSNT